MANYEIDIVSIIDGKLVTLNHGDILLGMKTDGTEFYVLRISNKR